MKLGSLCSGGGGLDLAVEALFGAETVWHAETDKAATKVLAHRWPGVPNHGDIATVDWCAVEPVDILAGGFPCQDVSTAGRRAGMRKGTRSGLWAEMAGSIAVLGPRIVVIENVKGLLSVDANRDMEPDETDLGDTAARPVLRAAGAVLGDLADLGYDARWATVSASSVGAPHRRERVFIVAHAAGTRLSGHIPQNETGLPRRDSDQPLELLSTPQSRDWKGTNTNGESPWQSLPHDLLPSPDANMGNRGQRSAEALARGDRQTNLDDIMRLLPTPSASDGDPDGGPNNPANRVAQGHHVQLIDLGMLPHPEWGKYSAAIRRWENLTRPAPPPVEPNRVGKPRLHAPFSEWMMGWPDGWATQVPGISRNDALRITGNGVVPQQAAAALRHLLSIEATA